MEIFKTTPRIPFLKYKFYALGLSSLIVLAGIVNVFFGKGLKLGVDFGEGTLVRVMFKAPKKVADLRGQLAAVGLGSSVIQEAGKNGREFQIRTMEVKTTGVQTDDLESHAALSTKVISSLRGEEGQAEQARGLRDLNAIDLKTLTALLDAGFAGKGAELAAKVIDYRNTEGIFASFAELDKTDVGGEVKTYLTEKTYLGGMTVMSRESVGPQVGKDLRKKAVSATLLSLVGMLIYVAFRFNLSNGVSAIFTLFQDVLITMSIYSFTSREINLPIIAGILTIVGFSINDTIVIFDRIRENKKTQRKMPLEELMNLSLNQMLGRTFITSGTVFLTVLALFLFGGPVINDFAFLWLVGTIEGVYSTIYLSCPVVLLWEKWFPNKKSGRK
jgi:preprotein translocase subunit SecF